MSLMTFECLHFAMEQMKKSVCKINLQIGMGTGFFCKIPFPDMDKMLPVLITNHHIINDQFLNQPQSKICISIKDENEYKEIVLDNRIKYTNREYDITIIEIKEMDGIKDYLELDDIIIDYILKNNNMNEIYIDNEVYMIEYPQGTLSLSTGSIKNIQVDRKYIFSHKCETKPGSAGSPILNIRNNKVIGVHHSKRINMGNCGFATFLNYPIKEFISLNHK